MIILTMSKILAIYWEFCTKPEVLRLALSAPVPPNEYKYYTLMRESNRNLDIPPPGHTPGNLDFDVLVRSNSLHIFVIPVQIHHVLWKIGVQIPHPMYELEATAFRNFGITKFFFPSETLFNRSEPFSFSQPRIKLISSHLNSPSSLAPFWIQHTCLKEKFKFPTP